MTKIEFLLLGDTSKDDDIYSIIHEQAQLASDSGGLYIHTQNATQSKTLDEYIRAVRPSTSMPHAIAENLTNTRVQKHLSAVGSDDAKILIGSCSEPDGSHRTLINTNTDIPWFFSRFEHFIELIQPNENARSKGRERYLYYKYRGYPLQHRQL